MDPITGFLINLVISLLLGAASTLLQQANQQQAGGGTRASVDIGGKIPQYFLMGTVGEMGKREYRGSWGTVNKTPNAHVVDVLSFGDLPITAMVGAFVNGTRITLGGTEVLQGFPSAEFKNKFWWKFYDGTQTTPSAYLTGKFGGVSERPWNPDMIGRGIPVVITTARWDEKVFNKFPEFIGEFQGIKLYDVRKDSTAGGSGPQRWADPSTWAFSDNNAVMIYNILRGIYYEGVRVWGGSCEASQLPYDVWSTAMNACDEVVELQDGGSEKRFRAGLRVDMSERPSDVIVKLLVGCNARISPSTDGSVYILVGVPDTAEGSFSDLDVLGTNELGTVPFPNLDSIINGGTATYNEPEQAWETKETTPYIRTDLEAQDDGRQQLTGIELTTTFSGTQAQRILKAVIEEGRRFITHVVVLPPQYARFHPLSTLAWSSERFGYTNKMFLVTARTVTPWGSVVLGLHEVDPSDHDWDAEVDESSLSFAPIAIETPTPQPMTGWSVIPYTHMDATNNARRPGIEVGFEGNLDDVRAVRVQIRMAGEATAFFDNEYPYDPAIALPGLYLVSNAILGNEPYEVRGIFLPFSGRETLWSSWIPVTTPNVKMTAADIYIDLAELGNEIGGLITEATQGIRDLRTRLDQTGRLLAETAFASYDDWQQLDRSVSVQLGELSAGFRDVVEVALGPGGSVATRFEEVYAALGGSTAGINVFWTATAGPAGYAARYFQQAMVNNDGVLRTATMMMDVPANPLSPTRIVFDAQQVVFIDSSDPTNVKQPFVFEGGKLKFIGARAGRITSADEVSFIIDFDDPEIYMES